MQGAALVAIRHSAILARLFLSNASPMTSLLSTKRGSVQTRMVWGERTAPFARLRLVDLHPRIQTAFVERLNLTIR